MSKKPPKITLSTPAQFIASGFGAGLSSFAPGTVGTLAAIPLWVGLSFLPLGSYLLFLLIASLFGIWVCGKASRELNVHDHGGIVWDEFVGLWITLIAIPLTLTNLLLGFLLFRLLDIIKPWPIRVIDQKVSGGFGIMLDDMIAGGMAAIILHSLLWGMALL